MKMAGPFCQNWDDFVFLLIRLWLSGGPETGPLKKGDAGAFFAHRRASSSKRVSCLYSTCLEMRGKKGASAGQLLVAGGLWGFLLPSA